MRCGGCDDAIVPVEHLDGAVLWLVLIFSVLELLYVFAILHRGTCISPYASEPTVIGGLITHLQAELHA